MATSKQPVTVSTDASVDDFLAAVPDERRRADAKRVCTILCEVTGEPAVMWGPSIVGFGSYHYTYESGRTGDWPLVGFSPRKQQLVVAWHCSTSKVTDLVMTPLRMALWQRDREGRPAVPGQLIHHSDAGSPVHEYPVHRAPRAGGHRAVHRIHRRRLRQRSHGDHQRAL